jgi:hypothetical protein
MARLFDGDMILKIAAILVVILIALYIVDPTMMGFLRPKYEGFQAAGAPAGPGGPMAGMGDTYGGGAQQAVETPEMTEKQNKGAATVVPTPGSTSSSEGFEDGPANFGSAAAPAGCYPRDQITPAELLPKDPNSVWAQQNPMGNGSLKGKNFLSAGALIGVNTVGQSLRNANYSLRSEPPNPQMPVSIWQQSTIEPDVNRRTLEIA